MSSKTKIVVLRMKEVIYTGIFIGLALLLLILCFIMFRPAKKEASTSSGLYIPGLYSASLTLGNEQVNVEVTVDSDQILDVSLVHLNEAVSTIACSIFHDVVIPFPLFFFFQIKNQT